MNKFTVASVCLLVSGVTCALLSYTNCARAAEPVVKPGTGLEVTGFKNLHVSFTSQIDGPCSVSESGIRDKVELRARSLGFKLIDLDEAIELGQGYVWVHILGQAKHGLEYVSIKYVRPAYYVVGGQTFVKEVAMWEGGFEPAPNTSMESLSMVLDAFLNAYAKANEGE